MQAAQILKRTAKDGTADTNQAAAPGWPLGPYPPSCPQPTAYPAARHVPNPPLQKETLPMAQPEPVPAIPTDVYLLFAHEPYYPAAAQEINTTVVAASSLLHPRVRQPDGARIHDRLVRGRRPGEIVPLSTLTHELDGGERWPEVGDWETVTEDLLQLIRDHETATPSDWACRKSPAPWCVPARTARSVPSTPPPGHIEPTGPPTGSRSSSRLAGTWPGPKEDRPCGPATACCLRSTAPMPADVGLQD